MSSSLIEFLDKAIVGSEKLEVKIFKEGNLDKANQLLKGRYALTTHLPSVQQSFLISELTVV